MTISEVVHRVFRASVCCETNRKIISVSFGPSQVALYSTLEQSGRTGIVENMSVQLCIHCMLPRIKLSPLTTEGAKDSGISGAYVSLQSDRPNGLGR